MITKEFLLDRYIYDDGRLLYRKNIGSGIAGQEVGTFDRDGYKRTTINRKPYRIHRLIFMMHYGYIPKILDHIDKNPNNNKIENIRIATHSQNNSNRGMHKRNVSGYKGVAFLKDRNLYRAKLVVDKKQVYMKTFKTAEEAYKAYCNASKQFCKEFSRT